MEASNVDVQTAVLSARRSTIRRCILLLVSWLIGLAVSITAVVRLVSVTGVRLNGRVTDAAVVIASMMPAAESMVSAVKVICRSGVGGSGEGKQSCRESGDGEKAFHTDSS